MPSSTKVLTVNELAEYLRVHRSTIYRLLKKGQLPGFKIGSDWRFNVEVIDEWRLPPGSGAAPGEGKNGARRIEFVFSHKKIFFFSLLPFTRLTSCRAPMRGVHLRPTVSHPATQHP